MRKAQVAPVTLLARLALGGMLFFFQGNGFGPAIASAQAQQSDGDRCATLASHTDFPLPNVHITMARWNHEGPTADLGPFGTPNLTLPAHCQIQGVVDERTGADGYPYGTRFEVRLPASSAWNHRLEFQGGGGTDGSLPPAIGSAGSGFAAGATPPLAAGWAIVSDDGGHESNGMLGTDPKKAPAFQFALDPQAAKDFAYNSLDVSAQMAKYLIKAFYGQGPAHSYFVGCSQGGREGLVFADRYPTYFDGIVAGEPAFNHEAYLLTTVHISRLIASISPKGQDGRPQPDRAFSPSDRVLFTKAILSACDKLDGLEDGVVDYQAACNATFNPATFKFPDTGKSLQCVSAKTDECLSPEQVSVIAQIHRGPRNSSGARVIVPAQSEAAPGIMYDGGILEPAGIPSFFMRSAEQDFNVGPAGQLSFIGYMFLKQPNPSYDALKFNFDTDVALLNNGSPYQNFANSYDAAAFAARGGKLILFGGASSPGPSEESLLNNYARLAKPRQNFARMFIVPNMGHCTGGASTDKFDLLSPLVAWVEQGKSPDRVPAVGSNFPAPAKTRTRPLCAYPKVARYTGPPNGDITVERNYSCVVPPHQESVP